MPEASEGHSEIAKKVRPGVGDRGMGGRGQKGSRGTRDGAECRSRNAFKDITARYGHTVSWTPRGCLLYCEQDTK